MTIEGPKKVNNKSTARSPPTSCHNNRSHFTDKQTQIHNHKRCQPVLTQPGYNHIKKHMTSPQKSISQAHLCACVCVDVPKNRRKKKKNQPSSSGRIQLNKGITKPRRHQPPSSLTLPLQDMPPLSQNALLHSQKQVAMAPNLFNLCNTPASHSQCKRCCSLTASDAQSNPHISLTQRHAWRRLALPLRPSCSPVCFWKDDWRTHNLFLSFLFIVFL